MIHLAMHVGDSGHNCSGFRTCSARAEYEIACVGIAGIVTTMWLCELHVKAVREAISLALRDKRTELAHVGVSASEVD